MNVFHSRRVVWPAENPLLFCIPSIAHCGGEQATRGYESGLLTPGCRSGELRAAGAFVSRTNSQKSSGLS